MREPEVVALEATAVSDELSAKLDARQSARLRGALAALEWALGRRSQAPASGRLVESPDLVAISTETAWAYEVVVGVRAATPPVTRDFAGGVEEALMWLTGSDCPPVPTNEIYALTTEPVRLLPVERFESLYEAMNMERASPPGHFDRNDLATLDGIIAGCEWLLNKRSDCPVLGTPGPAEAERVAAAEVAIGDAIQAIPLGDPRRSYAFGVGITLEWAVGRSSRLPCVY